jgi:hypothetical protein
MTYSFQIKAQTKEAAKAAVVAKFDDVIVLQPVHARDRAAVLANANSVIDLLGDSSSKDVLVSVNGYVSAQIGPAEEAQLTSASISASAGLVDRT